MYTPSPIDTNHIQLNDDILALSETLAKNTHEVWAAGRIAEGWVYGENRDDSLKHHPCLVPYEALPESEKEYDRATAIETLKVIMHLGFDIKSSPTRLRVSL
ncbi:MAG: RyR domain-containing protein [Oscillospiraceae bacterium]|nr:RyR domain-containing protein [Oscillospiraceae bacterium]